jgi:hypothetical protein
MGWSIAIVSYVRIVAQAEHGWRMLPLQPYGLSKTMDGSMKAFRWDDLMLQAFLVAR